MKQIIALFMVLLLGKTVAAQKLTINDKTISIPGKQVVLNSDGFPAMIQTSLKLITEPIHFHLPVSSNHKDIKLKSEPLKFSDQKPGEINWSVKNISDSLTMQVNASLTAKGLLSYAVEITAVNDIDLDNIRLHLPITPEAAGAIKGLGLKEQKRPDVIDWKWASAHKGEDKVWIGDTAGGLQYQLSSNESKTPPSSWSNSGKGGIHIEQKGKAILADNYSGEHHLKKGDKLSYNFTMLITGAVAE
jgi:hypothetical protein